MGWVGLIPSGWTRVFVGALMGRAELWALAVGSLPPTGTLWPLVHARPLQDSLTLVQPSERVTRTLQRLLADGRRSRLDVPSTGSAGVLEHGIFQCRGIGARMEPPPFRPPFVQPCWGLFVWDAIVGESPITNWVGPPG